ncbi:hypothetical protein Tco_0169600 [Tanacetum coccineum]
MSTPADCRREDKEWSAEHQEAKEIISEFKTITPGKQETRTHFQGNVSSCDGVNTVRPKIVKTARSYRTPVNTVRPKVVNTARQNRTSVNAARANGFNAAITGNIAYLSDFKEFDGGYVTFRGGAYGGKISGKVNCGIVSNKFCSQKTADVCHKQDEDGLNNENAEQERFSVDSSSKDVNVVGQQVNTATPDVNTGSPELNVVGPLVSTSSPNKEDITEEEPESIVQDKEELLKPTRLVAKAQSESSGWKTNVGRTSAIQTSTSVLWNMAGATLDMKTGSWRHMLDSDSCLDSTLDSNQIADYGEGFDEGRFQYESSVCQELEVESLMEWDYTTSSSLETNRIVVVVPQWCQDTILGIGMSKLCLDYIFTSIDPPLLQRWRVMVNEKDFLKAFIIIKPFSLTGHPTDYTHYPLVDHTLLHLLTTKDKSSKKARVVRVEVPQDEAELRRVYQSSFQ